MKILQVPLRLQNFGSKDCGVICSQMVLEYFGIKKSSLNIAEKLTYSTIGTSAYDNGSILLKEKLKVTTITAHPFFFSPDKYQGLLSKQQVLTAIEETVNIKKFHEYNPSLEKGSILLKEFITNGGQVLAEIPSFKHIKEAINDGSPVIALIFGCALGIREGGYHFVVIAGYDHKNVFILNPLRSSKRKSWFPIENFLFALHCCTTFDIDNLLSKRPYRGINLWLLLSLNYERNLFLTWDQLKKIGASVKQGEHGHVVIYWKTPKKTEEKEGEKEVPILRYYKVFNIAQCRDLPENLVEAFASKEHNSIAECEAIIAGMPACPPIKHKEDRAFYHIDEDYINMPKKKLFTTPEGYYVTLFHELVHSTGSEKRLNRKTISEMYEMDGEPYCIEELVAELGSAYLSSFNDILNPAEIRNNAAYINGWLNKLKGDKRFIVQASGQAQRAVDFIINLPVSSDNATEEVAQPDTIIES